MAADAPHNDILFRCLWLAVISQAAIDAQGWGSKRRQAHEWLTTRTPDLEQVCEMAGVRVERVLRRFDGLKLRAEEECQAARESRGWPRQVTQVPQVTEEVQTDGNESATPSL